jgi:hypothetical protein
VVRRRAAALGALALLAAGCGSNTSTSSSRLPATGPPGVVRIGLAHLLWPLDPALARDRDEIALARALFATPLRTDPETGALRQGLCSSWRSAAGGRTWRFHCRHAGAIASTLRRVRLIPAATIAAPDARTLVVTLAKPNPELPYVLTEVAAAPRAVPGPFRLISASPKRVVAERDGVRLVFRKLEPHAAQRLFRRGHLDEAPVPLGDLQAALRDPQLRRAVRVRRLLAVDLVVAERGGSLARLPDVRRVYDDTADRADYQALVPEFEAPPATSLDERPTAKVSRAAVVAARTALKQIASLPHVAVRFEKPADPDDVYAASLLVAAWRDLRLGPFFGPGRPDARFERLLAPYPRFAALRAAVRGRPVIPIAWAVDARLVSPRLRGWREDELGAVDYSRVKPRGLSRSR